MIDEEALEKLPWKFTPYYGHPHEYVIADWSFEAREAIEMISSKLASEGYEKKFYKITFHYVDIGLFTYWVMGKVLNRIRKEIHAKNQN